MRNARASLKTACCRMYGGNEFSNTLWDRTAPDQRSIRDISEKGKAQGEKMTDIIAGEADISIRKMTETRRDFEPYLKWMTDPETMKYWEGMTEHYTYDRVVREYREAAEEQVEQCMIECGGNTIGYCQFCLLDARSYEVPETQYDRFVRKQDAVYGIDIFLGETDCRDRGIGTKCMKALMRALFEDWHADMLMIDPKTHNARAIRCYHKCGFRDLFVAPKREL